MAYGYLALSQLFPLTAMSGLVVLLSLSGGTKVWRIEAIWISTPLSWFAVPVPFHSEAIVVSACE